MQMADPVTIDPTYAVSVSEEQDAQGAGRWRRDRVLVTRTGRRLTGSELEDLVARIRAGESAAWDTLVRCLSPAIYRGLGAFNLSPDAKDEVFSSTWVRLLENIHRIEKPASLASWLMTTAHNEALQLVKARSRQVPTADLTNEQEDQRGLDESLLDDELRVAIWRGFQRLSPRCQELLRLLTVDPPLTYVEIHEVLGWPVGSIGPNRGRCLDALRAMPEVAPFLDQLPGGRHVDG